MKPTRRSPYLENVICQAKPHWLRFSWVYAAFLAGMALVALAVFGNPPDRLPFAVSGAFASAAALCVIYYRTFIEGFSFMAVTDRHLIQKKGILNEEVRHVPLETALAVRIERPLMGRLLGFGHVEVMYDGNTWARAKMISNPIEFQRAVTAEVGKSKNSEQKLSSLLI